MRIAWVKIDIDRLSLRLRATTGRSFDDWELIRWLTDSGYNSVGGQWYACPEDTGALRADEILEKQMRETINGVTFVDRDTPRPPGSLPT